MGDMEDSVILSSPFMLALFGVSLLLCVAGMFTRSGYMLFIASAALAVGASAYSLIMGADMKEVLAFVLVLLALNATAFGKGRGKK